MVECHCDSNKCNGKDIDCRTQRSHSLQDRVRLVEAMAKEAKYAEDVEIERIGVHLASITLADEIPASPSISGGRLWNQTYCKEQLEASENTPSGSRQQVIRQIITRLSEIEALADTLDLTVTSAIESLETSVSANLPAFPLRHLHADCLDVQTDLSKITFKAAAVTSMKGAIVTKVDATIAKLQLAKATWITIQTDLRDASTETTSGIQYSTERFFKPLLPSVDPILQLVVFIIIAAQTLLGASRNGCSALLGMLRYLVQLCFMRSSPQLAPQERKILSDFPSDPRSVEDSLDLEPDTITYAVCPDDACQATYSPKYKAGSPIPIYPSRCQNHRTGKRCREQLLRPRKIGKHTIYMPIKPFVYFNPVDWLGRLLARPGIEAQMDATWERQRASATSGEMHDIFDGEVLRKFKGPGGRAHFSQGNGEGRYVFSLSVDFFNPLGNKQAGKKILIGVVTLVCLNLPPHLRYKPENMFLAGVIPGPREPPLTAINYFLKPIVDDFLKFWDPGVRFTRTDGHPLGRLVRCALVCIVCDLPAARKTAGFAAASHTQFCSVCRCNLKSHGYGDLDFTSWRRKTNEYCRRMAKRYHNSSNESQAEKLVSCSGIRWSQLLRLPYFDPSRMVVVDAMHNLFLGLIREHFDTILGLRLPKPETDPAVLTITFSNSWKAMSKNECTSFKKIVRWLEHPMSKDLLTEEGTAKWQKRLANENRAVLGLLTVELGCEAIPADHRKKGNPSRADYARGILYWRKHRTETDPDPTGHFTSGTKCGHVLTKQETAAIHSDITNMVRPSWLTSVPVKLGLSGHGKLKADQWRVIGTTLLPITLTRLWSTVVKGNPRSERCYKILEITLHLVSAVVVASSRITSPAHADKYLDHMLAYLEGLREIFPDYNFVPNQHMAIHLYEYILFFGPVHSWWTFPFERVIGMLQRISTNYKPGQYESTISRSFMRASNLRNLFHRAGTPEVIQNCKSALGKLTDPQVRNTLITDILALSCEEADPDEDCAIELERLRYEEGPSRIPQALPDALEKCIFTTFDKYLNHTLLSHLIVNGITYSTSSRHLGNSSVLLVSGSNMFLPARIDYITQIDFKDLDEPCTVTYVAARKYKSVSLKLDPFALNPFLQAELWSEELGKLELYPLDSIQCHFAHLPISWEARNLMVVVSLSRDLSMPAINQAGNCLPLSAGASAHD